jgi:hypothetical protein
VREAAVVAELAFTLLGEGVAHSGGLASASLGREVALVIVAVLEAALIAKLAVVLVTEVVALTGGTRGTGTTSTSSATSALRLADGAAGGVGVSAVIGEAAATGVAEVAAQLEAFAVVLGLLLQDELLSLLALNGLLASTILAARAAAATASSIDITLLLGGRGLLLALGLGGALALGSGLLLLLLLTSHVEVLALVTEAALSTAGEVAASLLLASLLLLLLRAVRDTLVLDTVKESAAVTEAALLLLLPVVAVTLGGVVTRGRLDLVTLGVLVLALGTEAAVSSVSERAADFLAGRAGSDSLRGSLLRFFGFGGGLIGHG